MKVGFAPFSDDLSDPTDRFRFGSFLRARGIPWERAETGRADDVIVLSLAADLSVWSRLPKGGPPIVFDIVDPYMFTPRGGLGDRLRALGKRATGDFSNFEGSYRDVLDRMLARADAVVCGGEIQKAYIAGFCPNVRTILDDHADTVRETKSDYVRRGGLSLVWEGMLGNVAAFREILPAIEPTIGREDASFRILTKLESPRFLRRFGRVRASDVVREIFPPGRVDLHAWQVETFSHVFTAADVALVPVPSGTEFYRAKSASKLLLAARQGLPILCSDTPAYRSFAEGADVPMTCRTPEEWEGKLALLAGDEAMRREWGTRAREYAETHYSSEILHTQWAETLASVGVRV